MEKSLSAYIAAITLITTLAAPRQLAAQEQQTQKKELPRYTVVDLGPGADWVGGVNNKGNVDGTAALPDRTLHAFLWQKGAKTVLGTFGGPNSVAFEGPTERGQVVGKAETSTPDPFGEDFCLFGTHLICLPFIWQSGVMTPLPTLGGNNGIAFGVNNRGQVAGTAENTTQDSTCPTPALEAKPVVWQQDTIKELPTFASDPDGGVGSINDDGQAVGISGNCATSPSYLRNVLWKDGTVIDLGNLGGTVVNQANSINNKGQVVGFSDLPGDTTFHAFLWTMETGMQDLGTLPGDVFSGGNGNNDKGQVVGFSCNADFSICRAFLWQNDTMTDLNTLVPGGGSTLFLVDAWAVNSHGSIVSFGVTSTDEPRVFLLTPIDGEVVSESVTPAAPSGVNKRQKVVLPENVRQILRRRLGVLHNIPGPTGAISGKADFVHDDVTPSNFRTGDCDVNPSGKTLTGYCTGPMGLHCVAKYNPTQCPPGEPATHPQYVHMCVYGRPYVDTARSCNAF